MEDAKLAGVLDSVEVEVADDLAINFGEAGGEKLIKSESILTAPECRILVKVR